MKAKNFIIIFIIGVYGLSFVSGKTFITDYKKIPLITIDSSLVIVLKEISNATKKCELYNDDSSALFVVNTYNQNDTVIFYVSLQKNTVHLDQQHEIIYGGIEIDGAVFVFMGMKEGVKGIESYIIGTSVSEFMTVSFRPFEDTDLKLNLCGECRNTWILNVNNSLSIVFTEICIR